MEIGNSNFNVQTDGNVIENINELLNILDNSAIDFNSNEYLESLLNWLVNSDITNKDHLIEAISSKLLEYNATLAEQTEISNAESLKTMQTFNKDLEKLGIIETKKDTNDSKKDIDYITIRHDNGEVEMLVCAGNNTLNEFLKNNSDKVATMSAEEIFHYFKEYIHVNLKFYKEDEIDKVNPNLANSSLVNSETIKTQEREEVLKYAQGVGLTSPINVTVDPSGERIYMVDDAIIKFMFDYEGKRIMQVLVEPSILNNLETNLEDDYSKTEIFDTEMIEAVNSELTNNEEPYEEVNEPFDLDRLKDLIVNRDVFHQNLSSYELRVIDAGIDYLLRTMIERAESHEFDEEEQSVLDDYVESLTIKQDNNEVSLTDLEKHFIEQYLRNKEIIKSRGLDKKVPMKILENPDALPRSTSGIASIVMLLEIVILGMMILAFLSLDI